MQTETPYATGAHAPFELLAGPILLRPWQDDDIDAAWDALQDPEIRLWNGSGSASRDDASNMLRARQDWGNRDHASWAIAHPVTRKLLGSLSLYKIDHGQGTAEIGYWTVPAARGRGAATTAVDAGCRWAFGALGLERVELCHAVENTASARVAEKAGFVLGGRRRRTYRYGDGIRHDELCWSRLRDDPAPHL